MQDFTPFLESTEVVDFKNSEIQRLAQSLCSESISKEQIAKNCFNYVRDEIEHTGDFNREFTTCNASDVLNQKTGWCYAKSHLLCALLRANNIPCGFSYQRLSIDDTGAPYSLHGLNALYLEPYGWFKVDARGNKEGMSTEFLAGKDSYAFKLNPDFEEYNIDEVRSNPHEKVLSALSMFKSTSEMKKNFPDN